MARPARCAPSAGTSSENRCATSPIWANSPSPMPADSVRNRRSRQSSAPGNGRAAADVTDAAGAPGASPSGVNPICWGVRENTASASTHIVTAMQRPIAAAASGKSQRADGSHPERREDDAADAAAVVGHGERGGPRTHEPRRDNGIESRRAHRPPSRAAQRAREKELPGRRHGGPAEDAGGEGERAGLRDGRERRSGDAVPPGWRP